MLKKIYCLIFISCCVILAQAQTYSSVKVTMNTGMVIKGKKATMNTESVSLYTGGIQNTYQLSDIQLIQAKEGKAAKWALGCGGGCLAVCIIAGVATGRDGIEENGNTVGQYVAGSIIWTGIFAGVGALIGGASDSYQNVYSAQSSYLKDRFKLDLASNQMSKYNFVLSYKF